MQARDVFRLDNEVLAFRFTATRSDRGGNTPAERLTSPEHLRLWLAAAGIDPGDTPSARALRSAIELREAIYRIGSALAGGSAPAAADLAVLNTAAAGAPIPALRPEGSVWILRPGHGMADALAVIARDAILTLDSPGTARIKRCEGADCAGLFLDTSRGHARRWCSMNTCGNREKKARMREH